MDPDDAAATNNTAHIALCCTCKEGFVLHKNALV